MTALIVDDERLARLDLRHVLSAHIDVEIVGEADNADDAEVHIQALRACLKSHYLSNRRSKSRIMASSTKA